MDLPYFDPSMTGALFEGHYHASPKQPTDGRTFIEKLKRSIAPVKYAKTQAAAGLERAGGIGDAFKQLVENGFPENIAAPLAYECLNGERHINNLMSIFSIAEKNSSDEVMKKSPSDEFINSFIPYAQDVVEEKMQERWAKLLLGEMEAPGSFSRMTMNALSKMQQDDAQLFERLCSTSLYSTLPNGTINSLVPVLDSSTENGGSYNDGSLRLVDMGVLESLGLITTTLSQTFTIQPNSSILFQGDESVFILRNPEASKTELELGSVIVLKPGTELALLCKVGNAIDLENRLEAKCADNSLEFNCIEKQ